MKNEPRLSIQGIAVLRAFLESYPQRVTGSQLMDGLGVASGTLYPILARFEDAGWLKSKWEEGDPVKLGRPRRRFYTISGTGMAKAREYLDFVSTASVQRA